MGPDDLEQYVAGASGLPPVFYVTGESDLDYIAAAAPGTAKAFADAGVLAAAHVVPGANHFYPGESPVTLPDGRRSTLEDELAAFYAKVLG